MTELAKDKIKDIRSCAIGWPRNRGFTWPHWMINEDIVTICDKALQYEDARTMAGAFLERAEFAEAQFAAAELRLTEAVQLNFDLRAKLSEAQEEVQTMVDALSDAIDYSCRRGEGQND